MKKHPLFKIFINKKTKKALPICPLSNKYVYEDHTLNILSGDLYERSGCVILAGGQGTRLGFNGPKGCVSLPFGGGQSLFEIACTKIREKGKSLPVAIMTSPLNHLETVTFFQEHHYFGLENVSFFSQKHLPVCSDIGEIEANIYAPDGNGNALKYFVDSGLWKQWKQQGVAAVQILPIDNPKASPFDNHLLHSILEIGLDLSLKGIQRIDAKEKVGVVGECDGRLSICEYGNNDHSIENIADFFIGNTGIFACSMSFIHNAYDYALPWHVVKKMRNKKWIWQFETFIFDLFPYAKTFNIVLSDRSTCFSPLKTREGPSGFDQVIKALMK